ncbi:DMT family transporter [Motiliproteus sp.]|uniref:DMT family transporter n=1 Tax=Motiliproteus sp. TaxID=1898955 RepID=UPI003BAA2233
MSIQRTLQYPAQGVGLALMAAAMLLIPFVDGLAKYLSETHSPLYVSWARYAAASLVVVPIALAVHGRRCLPTENLGAHFNRTLFLVIAMTLYFVALSKVQMASAITAYFVGPIITAVLAVIFLNERLTPRKIMALVCGFVGTLIILDPAGEIEPGIIYALGSGLFFAFYLIATRLASKNNDPLKTLTFQCLVGSLILTPQAIWAWSVPQLSELLFFAAIGVLSSLSHLLSIQAFRYAEASLLAPLVYLELIAAAAVGYLFFDEVPALMLWVGAAVIMAGGVLLLNERRSS